MRSFRPRNTMKYWVRLAAKLGLLLTEPGIRSVVADQVKDRVADYLATYGRPEQIAAWREGTPYVAELAETSAGRQ